MNLNRIYKIYQIAVILLALLFLIYYAPELTPENFIWFILSVLGLMVMYLLRIDMPEGSRLSFNFFVFAIVLFSTGPVVLGWSAIIGNIFFIFINKLSGRRKYSLEQALFNGAQYALAGILAGWMYLGMGGIYGLDPMQPTMVISAINAIIVFFLANSIFVYLDFYLDPEFHMTSKQFRFYLISDLGIYIISGFTALMILHYYPQPITTNNIIEFLLLSVFFISPFIAIHLGIRLLKQTHELHQMFKIIRILNEPKELSQALREIMNIMRSIIHFDQVYIWEIDPNNNTKARLLIDYPESVQPQTMMISESKGLRGQALRTHAILQINDFSSAINRSSTEPKDGSMVIVPLIYENEIMGLIEFYRSCPHFYDKTNLVSMQWIADEIAVSMAEDLLLRKIQHSAVTDKLTGLHNRLYFEDRLAYDINRGQRYGQMVSLLFMDIDHFKLCNDTYGHFAGDSVLKQLAEILCYTIRKTDLAVRYGGEELTIILPNTAKEQAAILAEKIRQKIDTYEFIHEDIKIKTTVSIGVASFPSDASDPVGLVKCADISMYHAKQKGRNQVIVYEPDIATVLKK